MADSTLRFDIIGSALSAVRAFKDTGAAADDAAKQVDKANSSLGKTGDTAAKTENDVGRIRSAFSGLGTTMRGLFGSGGGGKSNLTSGLLGGIGPGIAGISALKASIVGLGGAVLGMLPALLGIGAALAVIGGAFAILMKTNKQFANDIKSTWKGIENVLKEAVTPMIKPLEQGFQQLGAFVKQIGPELKNVFAAAAPLVEPLIHGLTGLVGGVLPGLVTILKAAAPAMDAFGSILAHIGSSLGAMFTAAAPALAASSQLLKGLFGIVDTLLPVIVKLGASLATSLAPAFAAMTGAVNAILPALGAVGKVIGAFAGAVIGDLGSALSAVATLLKGIAPSLNILGKALASVFTVLENTGVFAVFGDALENIAKPLAGLINGLVEGLVPALPPIIALVGQFSSILVTLLSAGLDVMISALSAVVKFLTPILPLIVDVVAAVKAWSIAQTVLNVLLDANPIGVIVLALAVLIGIIVELVKHWHDVVDVAKTVWNVLKTVVTDDIKAVGDVVKTVMTTITGIFKAAWSLVEDVFRAAWAFITGFVRTEVDGVRIILSWFTGLGGLFRGWWDAAVNAVESVVSTLIGFVTGIPGKVLHALGDFGHLLWNAGAAVIQGLIGGIESAVGGLISTVSRIASDVSGVFSKILHIGSPSRVFYEHGQNIVAGLVMGIEDGAPRAAAAMRGLAAGGLPGVVPASAGGTGGGSSSPIVIRIDPAGSGLDQLFMSWLKNSIRAGGGDPQILTRKVVIA